MNAQFYVRTLIMLVFEVFSSKTFSSVVLFRCLSQAMPSWPTDTGWPVKCKNGVLRVWVGLGGLGLCREGLQPGCFLRGSTIKSFLWGCADSLETSPTVCLLPRRSKGAQEKRLVEPLHPICKLPLHPSVGAVASFCCAPCPSFCRMMEFNSFSPFHSPSERFLQPMPLPFEDSTMMKTGLLLKCPAAELGSSFPGSH